MGSIERKCGWRDSSNAVAMGNVEYLFIAIAPRSDVVARDRNLPMG